jgi:hypothetical protein
MNLDRLIQWVNIEAERAESPAADLTEQPPDQERLVRRSVRERSAEAEVTITKLGEALQLARKEIVFRLQGNERLINSSATIHGIDTALARLAPNPEQAEILRQIQAHLVSLKLQPMQTAPRDGKEVLLITNIGAVSAHYDKGMGWCETPDGREYFGPAWVCYDAAFELEIEETPEGELCPAALGWLPIPLATS